MRARPKIDAYSAASRRGWRRSMTAWWMCSFDPAASRDPVADERRGDHICDELPARGHAQVHLGFGVELQRAIEHDLADALTQLVAARLSHQHRLAVRQRRAQQLDLRGLARPLGPLERYEQSRTHLADRVFGGRRNTQPALRLLSGAASRELVLGHELMLQAAQVCVLR